MIKVHYGAKFFNGDPVCYRQTIRVDYDIFDSLVYHIEKEIEKGFPRRKEYMSDGHSHIFMTVPVIHSDGMKLGFRCNSTQLKFLSLLSPLFGNKRVKLDMNTIILAKVEA